MENPNGGVKNDVCNTIAIRIPTQTGSKPNANNAGPNKGITIKIISIKSRINPKKNIIISIDISIIILSTSESNKILLINPHSGV